MDKLFNAIKERNTDKAIELINNEPDINSVLENGKTPLMFASLVGHTEIIQILINNGARSDLKSKHSFSKGWTALMIAAASGHTEIVRILIANGANIHEKRDDGVSSLMLAVESGHTDTVKLLIDNNADVNDKNNYDMYSLMISAQKGHKAITQLLIENGAELNKETNFGGSKDSWTALIFAADSAHSETVILLLKYGAHITTNKTKILNALKKFKWWTQLHTAVIFNNLVDIAKLEYIDDAITALDIAVMCNNLEAVNTLIARDIRYDLNENLRAAVLAKSNLVAKLFLENGANPNSKSTCGQDAFDIANLILNISIVPLLMKQNDKYTAAMTIKNWLKSCIFSKRTQTKAKEENHRNNHYIF